MPLSINLNIPYVQYLNPQGELAQNAPSLAHDTARLITLYEWMVLLRTFDTKAIALQRTGKLGTYASTLGQEAIGVALGNVMEPNDVLCPDYRAYGAQIQRDVTLTEILTYWGGDERGSQFANNPHDFPISVPIGTQYLHAAGVAAAIKYRQQARVAVALCGDGGTSEGDFYEAMNIAGSWQLPVVFIINNNQWAISVPRSQQSAAKTLAQKAIAAGFDGIQVDGNDIIALSHVFAESIAKARAGQGPTLIEAITYRLCDHTTADDANRYRDTEELKAAWEKEPIKRLRNYLMKRQAWQSTDEETLAKQCAKTVDEAVEKYLNLSPQPIRAMFDYVYANLPLDLVEQCEQAQAIALQTESAEHA